MAVKIICPQCKGDFSVNDAFPGSKINCPHCSAVIILALEMESIAKRAIIPPGPKVIEPESMAAIHSQALKFLEGWLDVSVTQINNSLQMLDQGEAYTIWKIPKGDSSFFREITSPYNVLKVIQRRILDRLLYRIPVSNAAHGFVPGRSIVTNAKHHLKTAGAIFNLDLKDAFPSVKSVRIKHLYVRYLKIQLKHFGEHIPHSVLNHSIDLLVKLTTYNDCLPQGGPCSGYLLNIACATLDKNIYRLLSKYGDSYRYTRYADDITISGPVSIPEPLQQELQKTIKDCGFEVNPRKCHYAVRTKGQKLSVTGLIIEKNKVRIEAQKLETFRAIIHQASQIETQAVTQEKKLEIQSIVAFVNMVYDKLPHRIWSPYKSYIEKHNITYIKRETKSFMDLYPQ